MYVMSKILGIDYGARRVGLALSDVGHSFAFPKGVVENNESLMQVITDLVSAEGVTLCVVGEGDNPAGGVNTIARRIAIFAEALKVRLEIPVERMSEAFSSAEARRALEEKVANRKDKTIPVDAAAAAIILQTFLDSERHGHK